MQDLNDKVIGGTLTAAEWNEVPSELQNVIEALGITLSSGDLNQLGKAIAGYVANGTFYTDSGVANAYALSVIGSKQAPTTYTDGLETEFVVGNTNTGSSTVNVATLGVVDIAKTGAAGTLTVGSIVRLRFNLGTGDFDIVNNTTQSTIRSPVGLGRSNSAGAIIGTQIGVTSIVRNSLGAYTVTLSSPVSSTNNMSISINALSVTADWATAIPASTNTFNVDTFGHDGSGNSIIKDVAFNFEIYDRGA